MKRIVAILMTLIMVLGLSSVGVWADEATWQIEKPMPTARSSMASVVVDDKIYVLGGNSFEGNSGYATDIVEIYNTTTGTWSTGKSMPTKKYRVSAAIVNNKIYVFGGISVTGTSDTVEIFDLTTNTWSAGATMPTKRGDTSSVVVNGKIYIVGGSAYEGSEKLEIYDPQTNSWTTGSSMLTKRAGAVASAVGDKIYVYSGYTAGYNPNKIEVYDITTNTWTTKGALSISTGRVCSVVIGNKIYAIGGHDVNGSKLKNLEIYDTEADSWTTGYSINTQRSRATASLVGSKIYVIGGISESDALNSMESLQVGSSSTTPENPTSLTATGGNSVVDLSWGAVSGADSYTVKRSLTAGGPYTVIAEDVTDTTYSDTDVVNGTTYYYVVTAVSVGGESANSNEASATPQAPSTGTGKALLIITMTNGLEKEYEPQMSEVNSFVSWYDGKAAGNGQGYYTFNKNSNLGPFMNRTDYLTFDKIQNFEVMQYQ